MKFQRLITADDMFRVRWPGEPELSPDGNHLAFTVGGLDRERDAMVSHVYWLDRASREMVCLSPAGADDHHPRWSPDGRHLAFVANRGAGAQIWVADVESGEARQLTQAPHGAGEPAWSPDGRRLVFVAAVDRPHSDLPIPLNTALNHKADGIGLLPARRNQLWIVTLEGGPAEQLTQSEYDHSAPAWSPDGSQIAFISNRGVDAEFSLISDVWVMPVSAAAPRRVTAGTGPVRSFAWSPDGRYLAYLGHAQGNRQGVNLGVWVASLDGAPARNLTASADRCAGLIVHSDDLRGAQAPELVWKSAGDTPRLYFCFSSGGQTSVDWVTLDGHMGTAVAGERTCLGFSLARDRDLIAFAAADGVQPGEIYLAGLNGHEPSESAVTQVNAAWLAEVRLSQPERLEFGCSDGQVVEGWLLRPPDFITGQRCPLILEVHGGPHYPLGQRFCFDFQRLAAQGYCVLYTNPRGSQGYGEAFATAIQGGWGQRDYQDLMEVVDAVVQREEVDPARLAVTGVSYGGFMTNWIISHTDRFCTAVCENGLSNLTSAFGTTGSGQAFWAAELGGTPYDLPNLYRELSPLTHAANVHTPLLLLHAEQDYNCPIGQSEELFTALRFLRREVALLRIPEEGHLINLVGRPSHRLARCAAVDQWFAAYLKF